MKDEKPCYRCGGETPTYNYEQDSTHWAFFTLQTETRTRRLIRLRAQYLRRNPEYGSPLLVSDEERAMCADCWNLMIGRFMQGRSVPAMEGKEEW